MKQPLRTLFNGLAFSSLLLGLATLRLWEINLAGARIFPLSSVFTVMLSGGDRLILISPFFTKTGTFSPLYWHIVAISAVLPLIWLAIHAGRNRPYRGLTNPQSVV